MKNKKKDVFFVLYYDNLCAMLNYVKNERVCIKIIITERESEDLFGNDPSSGGCISEAAEGKREKENLIIILY